MNIQQIVRQVKAEARKRGYTCTRLEHSPYSSSVYFSVRGGAFRYPVEVRVSDHPYPHPTRAFRGYEFVLGGDVEGMMEDLIADLAAHMAPTVSTPKYRWVLDGVLLGAGYATLEAAQAEPVSGGILMALGPYGWDRVEGGQR